MPLRLREQIPVHSCRCWRSPRVRDLSISFATLILLSLVSGGCQSDSRDAATREAAALSGDVAKNAALARADTERAYQLIQKGKYSEAEPLLNRAVNADATYGPARNDLGLVLFQLDELYNAAWQFENAIKLMPGQPQPQSNLGLVYEKSGKLSDALKAYSRAVEIEPDNPEYAGNLARVRIRLGMEDSTTSKLLRVVVERDKRPEWVKWAQFRLIRNPDPDPASQPAEMLPAPAER